MLLLKTLTRIMKMANLTAITYNCQSFNKDVDFICSLSKRSSILLLQETLIPEHSFNVFNAIEDFEFIASPSFRDERNFVGRSSGGLLLAWKKELTQFIEPFPYSDRIIGVFLKTSSKRILLLNVYCPCDYRDAASMVEFKSVVSDLKNIMIHKR